MLLSQFITSSVATLTQAGVQSARLDCLVLLEDILGINRANLLAHPELEITPEQLHVLQTAINKRTKHMPLAYIRGKAPFFGREFAVNEHVLVPRPETEAMIEQLLQLSLPPRPTIADIGAGSGCIGITAALEIPAAQVTLYDISTSALAIAQKNAQAHNASVQCQQLDLMRGIHEQFDVLLANLPYVPNGYPINQAARHEPGLALFSGEDGLDHFRALWNDIGHSTHRPLFVLTESLETQHDQLASLAKKAGYTCAASDMLIQVFSR